MTRKILFALAFVAALGVGGVARADIWDTASDNDNGNGTDTELTHGTSQVHDLGAQPGPVADEDWFRLLQEPFSSYEALVDGVSGDVSLGPSADLLQRVSVAGVVLQTSAAYGNGYARSLRWANDTATSVPNEYVRVANADCATACTVSDQYRIRFWDTTMAVPRYNNASGQITVLIIQNPGQDTVTGNARLWTAAGGVTPVTSVPFTLVGRAAIVVNLSTVNAGIANGTSGTITITSDGRYGQLAAKAVALEPATGFSFDTPGTYKPVSS